MSSPRWKASSRPIRRRIATQISLIAEVANAYLTLLADKELLKLTEDTLRTQQQSYDLTSRSFDRGVGTQLDVAQARTAVETARPTVPPMSARSRRTRTR